MNNIEVNFQREVVQHNIIVYKVDCIFHFNCMNSAFIRNKIYFHYKDMRVKFTLLGRFIDFLDKYSCTDAAYVICLIVLMTGIYRNVYRTLLLIVM